MKITDTMQRIQYKDDVSRTNVFAKSLGFDSAAVTIVRADVV